eukprot:gene48123-58945_t
MASIFTALLFTGAFSFLLWIFLFFHHESLPIITGNEKVSRPSHMRVRQTVPVVDPDTGFIKFKPVYEDRDPILNPPVDNHAVDEAARAKKEEEEKKVRALPPPPPSSPDTVDRRGGVKGTLICKGSPIDSEVIYWRDVPKDKTYESPLTPHHHEHHSKYVTFEYDNGGWNNIRMGVETVI